MIDWNKIDYNKELNIELIEGENVVTLTATLKEYEWSPHRVPAIADVKIIKADDDRFNPGDVLRLPIITKDIEEPFLVSCPRPYKPSNQLRLKAKIILN
jgi:hypothetical protein